MKEEQLRDLLNSMSLKEKVFQLVQIPGQYFLSGVADTGTKTDGRPTDEELALVGSTLGIFGAKTTADIQMQHLKRHPHHIPLLFMHDVVHGLRTAFPIPLALGASFSPELVKQCSAAAAAESAASGLHVTFAPMLDLVRDPRWGRVMESFGEDPFLNAKLGKASVEGFRGCDGKMPEKGRVASCIKHFAAYGAAEAGRDYTGADLGGRQLREFYLPAYREALNAGADMVMSSFNAIDGIPATGNEELLRSTLREAWGFEGVLISDWNSVGELATRGVCSDLRQAAKLAMHCGVDIDMCSFAYARHLEALVREGEITEAQLDSAVFRVLELKNRLKLFEDPLRGVTPAGEERTILSPVSRALARKAVCECSVLLKNTGKQPLLPIAPERKTAFIGPYVDSKELHGAWAVSTDPEDTVSIRQAAEEFARVQGRQFIFSKGCRMTCREDLGPKSEESAVMAFREDAFPPQIEISDDPMLKEAVAAAESAETVVACLGEHRLMSGEGASRGELTLPEDQLKLLRSLQLANRNIVSVIFTGRPLDLREVCALSRSVLLVWMPGTEGGNGILDLLTGSAEPGGRLSMSMPYCLGQVPVYYNHFNTGRPKAENTKIPYYVSAYIDIPNSPLFPFGYGLGYTDFSVSGFELGAEKAELRNAAEAGPVTVRAMVKNIGPRCGQTVVQLYMRRPSAEALTPVKELKAFQKLALDPGEERELVFTLGSDAFCHVSADGSLHADKGTYRFTVGLNSESEDWKSLELL